MKFFGRKKRHENSTLVPSSVTAVRVASEDDEIVEEWSRGLEGSDHDIFGVDVVRIDDKGEWQWQVYISALEFVREDPLETEFSTALAEALIAVPGAVDVAREDTEKFIVDGDPQGDALTVAASLVVDSFAPQIQEYLDAQE